MRCHKELPRIRLPLDIRQCAHTIRGVSVERTELIRRVDASVPEILASVMRSLTDTVPFYREGGTAAFLDEVTTHMEAHLRAFMAIAAEDRSPRREDVAFMHDTIVRRVHQGFPLEGVLHAVRVGHRELWRAIVRHGEAMGASPEVVFAVTGPTFEYVDAVGVEMTRIYLAEQERVTSRSERERRDLLEDLLARRLPLPQTAAAGAVAPYDARSYAVLVAAPAHDDGAAPPDPLRHIAEAFARPSPFVVIRHEEVVGLLPVQPQEAAELGQRVRAVAAGLPFPVTAGVSGVCSSLDEFADGYRQAADALRAGHGRPEVVAVPEMSVFDYLLARADSAARELAARETGALAASRGGSVLAETLLAYIAADLNVARTAEALFVHPNTVHYRLARIGEATGRDLRSFLELVELLTAWRLRPA